MPNTSLKCAIKESIDRITGLFKFLKDSAHWRAIPDSREITKDTFARSQENWWGSMSKYSWHCIRKPLHSDTTPEYTVGLAMGQVEADEVSEDCSAAQSEVASSAIGSGSMLLVVILGLIFCHGTPRTKTR